jgi:hypothetical protein
MVVPDADEVSSMFGGNWLGPDGQITPQFQQSEKYFTIPILDFRIRTLQFLLPLPY